MLSSSKEKAISIDITKLCWYRKSDNIGQQVLSDIIIMINGDKTSFLCTKIFSVIYCWNKKTKNSKFFLFVTCSTVEMFLFFRCTQFVRAYQSFVNPSIKGVGMICCICARVWLAGDLIETALAWWCEGKKKNTRSSCGSALLFLKSLPNIRTQTHFYLLFSFIHPFLFITRPIFFFLF